jgi:alpha-tubulin suppressor-like RCC1 family protein
VRNASDAGVTGVTRVHVGDASACALKTDGSIVCWGAGRYGINGNGVSNNVPLPAAQVNGLNTTAFFDYGWNVAHSVDLSGNVKAWGVNGGGELGVGTEDGYPCWLGSLCKPSPVDAPLLKDAKQISVGYRTGVALMSNGKVLTWGFNSQAQLGHPANTNKDVQCTDAGGTQYCNPTPAELLGLP